MPCPPWPAPQELTIMFSKGFGDEGPTAGNDENNKVKRLRFSLKALSCLGLI